MSELYICPGWGVCISGTSDAPPSTDAHLPDKWCFHLVNHKHTDSCYKVQRSCPTEDPCVPVEVSGG